MAGVLDDGKPAFLAARRNNGRSLWKASQRGGDALAHGFAKSAQMHIRHFRTARFAV